MAATFGLGYRRGVLVSPQWGVLLAKVVGRALFDFDVGGKLSCFAADGLPTLASPHRAGKLSHVLFAAAIMTPDFDLQADAAVRQAAVKQWYTDRKSNACIAYPVISIQYTVFSFRW